MLGGLAGRESALPVTAEAAPLSAETAPVPANGHVADHAMA
jgi:hypothetical protein